MHLAALFDMDGLLIDSEASIMRAWLAAAAEMDIVLAPIDYLAVVGRSGPDAVALLSGLFGCNKRFELARRRVLERLDQTPASQRFPLKEGADALLAHLAEQDVPCAVASSSARDEIEARLTAVGIRSLFTAIVGGDEVARGKPAPLIYLEAASRLGVDTTHCIAFEDSHNGAKAVLASGAKLVLVPDLLQPTDDLSARAFCLLPSLSGAMQHVQHWFKTKEDA